MKNTNFNTVESLSPADFMSVISKLPHSSGRVPYTYHHDYLRMHSKHHIGMSRSDVAASHTEDDNELYAVALIQLLDELGSEAIYCVNDKDIIVCSEARKIVDLVINKYNEN